MRGRHLIPPAVVIASLALAAVVGAAEPPAFVPGHVIVEWAPGTERAEKTEAREEAEVTFQSNLGAPSFQLVEVEPGQSVGEAISELKGEPGVLVAERDGYATPNSVPNDPLFDKQWALQNIGASINGESAVAGDDIDVTRAWDRTVGIPSVVVADIDTGYRFNSADLAPVAWENPGEIAGNGLDDDGNGYIDDVHGWDFVGENAEAPTEDNDPTDDDLFAFGHGVHTAGIIGAKGNNGIGVTGVAQNVRIMPLRVCANAPATNQDLCPTSSIIAAVNYAGRNGARVANLSLGGGGTSAAELDSFADNPGTLYVTAAGNNGSDNDLTPFYPCGDEPGTSGVPGAIENIICVAATGQSDQLASFSDWGATSVDLGAPGTQILSTMPIEETLIDEDFEADDFGTKWEVAPGASAGFERTNEAPLTSFGIGDSPGQPPVANSVRGSRMRDPVAVPAGDGPCTLAFRFSVKDLGSGAVRLHIIKNGTDIGGFGIPETPGLEEAEVPFGPSLAGSSAAFQVVYEAGPSPSADSGVLFDDLQLKCREPITAPTGYGYMEGTSMAAPMVSGAAALLYSLKPSATVEEVEYALLEGVDPDPSLAGKTVSGGRLDVDRALDWLVPPAPVISTSPASPAADAAPRIVGSVDAGTQVEVFAGSGCHGPTVATGTPAQLESPGLTVSVPAGTTKEFSALVETRYATSPCSAAVSFTDPVAVVGPGSTITVPMEESHPSQSAQANPPATTSGPPAASAPACTVPKLDGKTLAKAEAALKGARCALGKVSEPKGPAKAKAGALVVAGSSPAAGAKTSGSVSLRLAPQHAKRHR